MSTISARQQALYLLLLFGMLLLLVPRAGYDPDVSCWVRWASYSLRYGLGNIYQLPDNNYNPLYHYVLWAFGRLLGSPARIEHFRHSLKAGTLLFDFAGALWAASLVTEKERRFGLVLALLLNLGYLYNSLVWEQVDAIYTFFAFGAVVLAVRQRGVPSVLCYVLAVAAKTQAIIFLPPLLLLWLPGWWQRPARLLWSGLAATALATLVLAPFIWGGQANSLLRVLEINLAAAHTFPVASMNAYNLWQLLLYPINPRKVADTLPFAGLAYRQWGLLLFGAASALALLPLLLRAGHQLRAAAHPAAPPVLAASPLPSARPRDQDLGLVLLSCGLLPLVFCFFNTQMHERYWHAAVLFLAAYAFLRRDYLPYALVSLAYFLNLEGVLSFTGLLNFSADFIRHKPHVTALLFAGLIGLCFVRLYRLAFEPSPTATWPKP